jgi:hypothetical protein
MKALRIHVERIVRPIRASVPRKNKMREELLAHLKAAFDEERVAAVTETVALDRAKERLGDPNALRKELQSSIPWFERLGHTRIPLRIQNFGYERGTTYGWRASARFASEIILYLVVSSPLLFAIACLVALGHGLNRPELAEVPGKLLIVAGLMACLWLALFVSFWLFDLTGGRQRVAPWNTTPPVIRACLVHMLWMVAIGLFLAMAIGFTEVVPLWTTANGPANILLATISVIVVTIPHVHWIGPALFGGSILFMSLIMRFERRQHETWGCLDIGDDTRTAD